MLAAGMKVSKEHYDFYKVDKVKIKNILPPTVNGDLDLLQKTGQ
jgi:hypothetical protein